MIKIKNQTKKYQKKFKVFFLILQKNNVYKQNEKN